MSKILVTGANGFIGERLCSKLLLSGKKVKKLVRKIEEGDNLEQYACNLGVDQIPEGVFNDVDVIFHLAGVTHDIDKSMTGGLYYDVNVTATEQLAMAAAEKKVKKFIYVSSVKAGGVLIADKCMSEEDQTEPEGVYGKTKREAEVRLLEIGRKSELNVSVIRPALVYGKGVQGNLHKMLVGIEKGWFPPLPEVGNRRSMIHVDDLVDALLLIEKNNSSNGEIFIATDGNDYSSSQIYMAMRASLNKGVKKWTVPNVFLRSLAKIGDFINTILPFPFDSYRYHKLLGDECFSSKKIQTILGFKAYHTIFSSPNHFKE